MVDLWLAGDYRAIYCQCPCQDGWTPLWVGDSKILIANHSLGYRGPLVVESVPKGSLPQRRCYARHGVDRPASRHAGLRSLLPRPPQRSMESRPCSSQ